MDIILRIGLAAWEIFAEMAPFLLLGFVIAGILTATVSAEQVEKHLGGRGFGPIVRASLFGVPLPLCSCGVIPVSASLRRHGANRGATAAFLLSTPQTGVDSILATYSLLGPVYAIFRPVAAFVTGLLGGALIETFDRAHGEDDGEQVRAATPQVRGGNRVAEALRQGLLVLPGDIARPLIVGLVLAGVIGVVLRPEHLVTLDVGAGLVGMLIMLLAGVPMYVCATGSIPIAVALIAKGLSPGAALVFLMTGPATNVAAIAIIWNLLGKRASILYMITIVVTALASGLLLNAIYDAGDVRIGGHAHRLLSPTVHAVCAWLLAVILATAILRTMKRPGAATATPVATESSTRLQVSGMTCSHCADAVARTLRECPGVTRAEVDHPSGVAVVDGIDVDVDELIGAIDDLGYGAEAAS